MANFNIKELIASAAFDYIGPPFPDWWKKNKKKHELPDLRGINKEQLQGGKYFMQLKLSYKGETFILPNEPLVSIGLTKTIVKTATVGTKRKGTVKEYVTTEDYTVSITGVCFDKDNLELYPANQVALLNNLMEINDALEVETNPFLELFGIRKLVFEDIKFAEMAGNSGVQSYQISAISDADFFADLNDKDVQRTNLLA